MAKEIPEELLLAHIGQKVLVMRDGKVLMCKGYQGLWANRWDFPGGRLNKDEQCEEGLKRELREELGVEFTVGKPLLTSITYDTPENIPRYYVVFEAALADPNAEFIVATDELADLKWVSREEVADLPTWEDWRMLLKEYFAEHA